MVAGNSNAATPPPPSDQPPDATTPTASTEENTARLVNKRYEALLMVRNKALRGKGAWYWAHLEPLLVNNPDTGLPKAVKLKCRLCDTVFSASNPSRTANEHLKRGTCPNFTTSPSSAAAATAPAPPNTNNNSSSSPSPRPISSVSPAVSNSAALLPPAAVALLEPPPPNHRKRGPSSSSIANSSYQHHHHHHVSPLSMIEPPTTTRYCHEVVVGGFSSPTPSPVASGYPHQHHRQQHHHQQHHLVLSGGKEDWGPLAMLKDNVKRLKSPKTSPGPALSKSQIDFALDCLADWVYESCGSVPFSSLEHPKFKAFLNQVGLPSITNKDFSGSKLDAKYEEIKSEAEAKIRDAMFFQISSDGWKNRTLISSSSSSSYSYSFSERSLSSAEESFVSLTVNLPNGTSVFRRALFTPLSGGHQVPTKYAEEVLWETIGDICGGVSVSDEGGNNGSSSSSPPSPPHPTCVQQCVGIIGDRFKNKALRNLENQHQWMVNLSCQYQALYSLINDFYRDLPLFRNVADNCRKLVNFVNNKNQVRICFQKYRLREYGHSALLRSLSSSFDNHGEDATSYNSTSDIKPDFEPVCAVIEDIIGSTRALQLVLLDDSYKMVLMEDPFAREFGEMIRDAGFWNDLEAVRSLVRLIKEMAHEVETERPLIGQCLPLWEELRAKVKDWATKFHFNVVGDVGLVVDKLIERRFKKNYHPAWAAAYILDPLYLIRDTSGKYLPPFKYLTSQQEKDVDKLITRLVSKEEAHIVLMELMKWRTEGLDPDYAQAVQLKQRDPVTGKMKIAIPQSSRLMWETYLTEFKSLGKVAVRLLFLRATSRGVKFNSSSLRWLRRIGTTSRAGMDRAHKMIFISANSKLDRRDFTSDEEKDAQLFAALGTADQDDVLNEVFVDTSSM